MDGEAHRLTIRLNGRKPRRGEVQSFIHDETAKRLIVKECRAMMHLHLNVITKFLGTEDAVEFWSQGVQLAARPEKISLSRPSQRVLFVCQFFFGS